MFSLPPFLPDPSPPPQPNQLYSFSQKIFKPKNASQIKQIKNQVRQSIPKQNKIKQKVHQENMEVVLC